MWLLLSSLALAGKWDGVNADIVTHATVAASPSTISTFLSDVKNYRKIVPMDCIGWWLDGKQTVGVGANAEVRYDMGLMHRRVLLNVKAASERYVDYEHPGKKGFTTRFLLTATETGTTIDMTSGFNPPPRPVRGYYYKVVKPEWERCQTLTLAALAEALK